MIRWEKLSPVTDAVFAHTVCVAGLCFGHGRQLPAFSKGVSAQSFFFPAREEKVN